MSTTEGSAHGDSLAEEVRHAVEPLWYEDFHRLTATLDTLPKPTRDDASRFLPLPPVYVVGDLVSLQDREFVLFTGLNPNGAQGHRTHLERGFDRYWKWCMDYFRSKEARSPHYDPHAAFLAGLLDCDSWKGVGRETLLADNAVAVDLCALASTRGWPEEQVSLNSSPYLRKRRRTLEDLRQNSDYPTFGISARVWQLVALRARCIVARYSATATALKQLYDSKPGRLVVQRRVIPFFVIPNTGKQPPSNVEAFELGRAAAQELQSP